MTRLNCLLVLATLLALALSASIKQEKKELDKKQTELIKRLLELYEKRAELKHEEELEEDKRTFGVEAEKRHVRMSEMMQSYIDKRSTGFMMYRPPNTMMNYMNDVHGNNATWKANYMSYITTLFNSVKNVIADPTDIVIWLDDDNIAVQSMSSGLILTATFSNTAAVQKSVAEGVSGYTSYAVFAVNDGVVSDSAMTSSDDSAIDDVNTPENAADLQTKAAALLAAAGQMATSAGSSGASFMWVKSEEYEVKYYKDAGFVVIALK